MKNPKPPRRLPHLKNHEFMVAKLKELINKQPNYCENGTINTPLQRENDTFLSKLAQEKQRAIAVEDLKMLREQGIDPGITAQEVLLKPNRKK